MSCSRVLRDLSAYIDGELSVEESCRVLRHLEGCAECSTRAEQLRLLSSLFRRLPEPQAPPDLALRLRVMASRFSVRFEGYEYVKLRMQSAWRALAVPAFAGLMGAACIFGFLLGATSRGLTRASITNDVPFAVYTPPRLARMPSWDVGAPVVVDASIDANGRVDGYTLISGPKDQQVVSRVGNDLLFSVFEPATRFGRPTSGHLLVSYDSIRVRG
jgi:predicted anti-sigma-YlaC factor YlaD